MTHSSLDALEPLPASEVKKRGWRGLHERIAASASGTLLVRNHSRPEGVLMTVEAYERLVREATGPAASAPRLAALTEAFEGRLAALRTPAGRRTLREALDAPLEFDEEVLPGDAG